MQKHSKLLSSWLMMIIAVVPMAACGTRKGETSREVLFFAAASTTDAIREICTRFENTTDTTVTLNFAASSTLAQQILAGAGADLFLSANVRWTRELKDLGLSHRSWDLLGNRLVIIVPTRSSIRLKEPQDLLSQAITRLSIADPEGVPAGIYARKALLALDLWSLLQPKVVRSFDVRQAMSFVEHGEAEAGIVYATDVAISEGIRTALKLDSDLTEPIIYPLVLMKAHVGTAIRLFEYLKSPQAFQIFLQHGFLVVNKPAHAERTPC